ncbi:MAG: hypothetical protein SO101_16335 [Lachnospiraceae bacterium]|nr:hypothetical protein [Lachnospiraceae bacterium]
MSKKQNQKDEEFLRSVREQLYIETFEKDVPDYSHEKVETLVKMLELEEGSDEQELEEAQKAFEERFRKNTEEKNRKNKKQNHTYRKRILRTAAAMLVIVMLADITSEAVMDKSIFHMISWWENQMSIRPGESDESSEPEMEDFQESETRVFTTVEEFAEEFGDDFLVCTWLPEGVELREIDMSSVEGINCYTWIYSNEQKRNVVCIKMYEKIEEEIAGLTGTQIEDAQSMKFINGIEAIVCVNADECMVAFEYDSWWYMIQIIENEKSMKLIIGGMDKYE